MGQYAFLINKKNKVRCESHKISTSGNESLTIEEPITLARFLDFCMDNKLQIECVSEHWFEENNEFDSYEDFEEL